VRSLAAIALALFGVIAMVAARTAAIGVHSTPTMPQGILGIVMGMTGVFAWSEASVITSKPANGDHFKTGHSTSVRDQGFVLLRSLSKQ
jgi:hypothetical protein